jgi:hypothetical protein
VDLNALLEAEETGKHELGTVADGVDRAVLNNDTLVAGQKRLEGRDDGTQVRLVTVVVVEPLGVENVVQRNEALGLVHGSRPDTAELLHVGTNTEEKTKVHAEGTDVGSGFAADPEDTELPLVVKLVEVALVDGTDTKLTLNGRDQRRTLEKRTGEGLESARKLRLAARELVMEADDANVLLSGTLLGLDETGGAVNADNQTSSDLGVEGSAVTSLLNPATRVSHSHTCSSITVAYLSMRLIHETTSCEEGFDGLSRLMTPELMYDLRSRARGAHPWGMGV